MKKLHSLVLKNYTGPFLASFSVALFVLVLQFVANYQDDIFGKGIEPLVIAQLFLYASVQLMVMALPIATMIASLNTLGRLGESYELVAMKSAGISLFRVLVPLIGFTFVLMLFSVYLTWYLVPRANLKLYSLLYDIQQAKPEMTLVPGQFDYKFDGHTLYFRNRGPNGILHDLMIWDHRNSPHFSKVLCADSAKMAIDKRLMYLRLTLYNAEQHEELQPESGHQGENLRYNRIQFDTLQYKFDISGFGLKRIDEAAFKSHQYMLTIWEMREALDSLAKVLPSITDQLKTYEANYLPSLHYIYRTDTIKSLMRSIAFAKSPLDFFDESKKEEILTHGTNNARAIKMYCESSKDNMLNQEKQYRRYQVEYLLKFTMPLSCLLMLFLGAPFGAIIRKGGLGPPTLISIGFFIVFYLLMTQGRKLAIEGVVEPWFGILLPLIIMAPIAFYVTYQSATDSKLFDLSSWRILFDQIIDKVQKLFFKNKN